MRKGTLIALSVGFAISLTSGLMIANADTNPAQSGANATASQPAASQDSGTSVQSPQSSCSANSCNGKMKSSSSSSQSPDVSAPSPAPSPIDSQD